MVFVVDVGCHRTLRPDMTAKPPIFELVEAKKRQRGNESVLFVGFLIAEALCRLCLRMGHEQRMGAGTWRSP